MTKILKSICSAFALLLAACAPIPPTPEDVQAKKFEAVPDRAVIYLVRTYPDIGDIPATIWLGDHVAGSTHPGTYFRWEVPPGRHRISGYGSDTGAITVDVQAGRIYFIRQAVAGNFRAPSPRSVFELMNDADGRAAVARAVRLG